jgi:hypothetical protein
MSFSQFLCIGVWFRQIKDVFVVLESIDRNQEGMLLVVFFQAQQINDMHNVRISTEPNVA